MSKKEVIKGFDYFKLCMLSFGTLGLELLLVSIENIIYPQKVSFDSWTILSHWFLTYIIWGVFSFFIIKYANKKYCFSIIENNENPKVWQWLLIILILIVSLIISYMDWNGFKIYIEFKKLGLLKFLMQYIYYFFETILFTLIIVFGQKSFEKWFKNEQIPYGGIICALTWGLAHIFTKSILVGLLSAISGFGFGAIYLLLNKNLIKTILILFIMFIV